MERTAHAMLIGPSKRQDRLQLLTVVYMALALLVLLGAITSDNNMLFWMVGVAIASIAVSGFIAGPSMMGLRLAHITAPAQIDAGASVRIGLTLKNINRRRTIYALRVSLEIRGPTGQLERIRTGLARLEPGQLLTTQIEHTLPIRGRWTIAVIRVSTTFPFGLSNKVVVFRNPRDIDCLPVAVRVDAPKQLSVGTTRPLPQPRAFERATGLPYALREYRPGDPRRSIAWKASARAARLMIREDEPVGEQAVWFRPMVSSAQLRDRVPQAERVLGQLRWLAEAAERAGRLPGLWHPETATIVPPGSAQGWRAALAMLGDTTGSSAGQQPPAATWIPVGEGDDRG
ncbi:MAG: DUF58 domain-containing protein [Planctomycetota bacterium]